MKILFLPLILLTCPMVNAQNNDTIQPANEKLTMFYVVDEVWSPNDANRWKTDDPPSFFQVEEGNASMFIRWRNNTTSVFGVVDGVKVIDEDDRRTTQFYIRGRGAWKRAFINIEVIEFLSGVINIHTYRKLGDGESEKYYLAHEASSQEVEEIREYYEK